MTPAPPQTVWGPEQTRTNDPVVSCQATAHYNGLFGQNSGGRLKRIRGSADPRFPVPEPGARCPVPGARIQ